METFLFDLRTPLPKWCLLLGSIFHDFPTIQGNLAFLFNAQALISLELTWNEGDVQPPVENTRKPNNGEGMGTAPIFFPRQVTDRKMYRFGSFEFITDLESKYAAPGNQKFLDPRCPTPKRSLWFQSGPTKCETQRAPVSKSCVTGAISCMKPWNIMKPCRSPWVLARMFIYTKDVMARTIQRFSSVLDSFGIQSHDYIHSHAYMHAACISHENVSLSFLGAMTRVVFKAFLSHFWRSSTTGSFWWPTA